MKKKLPPEKPRFEIESNAEELMEQHLKANPPRVKDSADRPVKSDKAVKLALKLDLHGMRLQEALGEVNRWLEAHLRAMGGRGTSEQLQIVTGKGLHSEEGRGVLISEVYSFVKQNFAQHIQSIDEAPSSAKLGGIPIRGHFTLRLKK